MSDWEFLWEMQQEWLLPAAATRRAPVAPEVVANIVRPALREILSRPSSHATLDAYAGLALAPLAQGSDARLILDAWERPRPDGASFRCITLTLALALLPPDAGGDLGESKLLARLSDTGARKEERIAACWALGARAVIVPPDSDTATKMVKALLEASGDRAHAEVRGDAIRAVGLMPPGAVAEADRAALRSLALGSGKLAKDSTSRDRGLALRTLVLLGDEEALEIAAKLLKANYRSKRIEQANLARWAALSLGQGAPGWPPEDQKKALGLLLDTQKKSTDSTLRAFCIMSIVRMVETAPERHLKDRKVRKLLERPIKSLSAKKPNLQLDDPLLYIVIGHLAAQAAEPEGGGSSNPLIQGYVRNMAASLLHVSISDRARRALMLGLALAGTEEASAALEAYTQHLMGLGQRPDSDIEPGWVCYAASLRGPKVEDAIPLHWRTQLQRCTWTKTGYLRCLWARTVGHLSDAPAAWLLQGLSETKSGFLEVVGELTRALAHKRDGETAEVLAELVGNLDIPDSTRAAAALALGRLAWGGESSPWAPLIEQGNYRDVTPLDSFLLALP